MAVESSLDSFWDHLRRSGLVSVEQLRALKAEFGDGSKWPQNARAVADELVNREILTPWQADNLLLGKHSGFRLGPHRILRPLGQGGMSKVYLAEHEMMHRRCAIKILPSKYQDDPQLLSRFHIEAEAIAKLDHPHIVRAYHFDKDVQYGKEIQYLVMEYVDGPDLRRLVTEQGPLDYRKAADLICQAAEGLAHAHSAGLIHRDIKPANLLVDPNGVLKILDLGLAKFIFEGEQPWQTPEGEQSAVGTADYVPPEQVMDPRSVDGRGDIYSLGLTFYYLLTGRRPFPKATLVELLRSHQTEEPEPLGKFRPDVPLGLVEIIAQMTAKKPIQRFQTAKEVAEKLQAWLHESESGREYSRISELMAAAMRGKQSPTIDGTEAKPELGKSADLELASLSEEPKPARGPAEGKMGESDRSGKIAKAAASAAVVKDKERKPAGSDSGAHRAVKMPDLLDDNLIAASSDPRLAVSGDQGQPSYVGHPQFKHPETASPAMSPWLWVGLAGLLSAVLLVLVLVFVPGKQHPSPVVTPISGSGGGTTSAASNNETPKGTTGQVEGAKTTTPLDRAVLPYDVQRRPPLPVRSTPPPPEVTTMPKPTTSQQTSSVEVTPPKADEGPAKALPSEPADPAKLLAEAKEVAFPLLPFRWVISNRKANQILVHQVEETTRQLGITIAESSPNTMRLTLNQSKAGSLTTLTLSGELKVAGPDGTPVSVWELKDQRVATIVPNKPERTAMLMKAGVENFFNKFAAKVRNARLSVERKARDKVKADAK
jgi:serine/threonine-protein kinase